MNRYLPLVLVVVVTCALGSVAYVLVGRGLQTSAEVLQRSARMRLLTAEVSRDVLEQDEATELLLLDPAQLADVSEAKIAAFDRQSSAMTELEHLAGSDDLSSRIAKLKSLDEDVLKPLDERLLEGLAGGDTAAATHTYFSEYLPQRTNYTKLIAQLAVVADSHARNGEELLAAQTQRTLRLLIAVFAAVVALVSGLFIVNLRRRAALDTNSRLERLVRLTQLLVKTTSVPEALTVLGAELSPSLVTFEPASTAASTDVDWARSPLRLPLGAHGSMLITAADTSPEARGFWLSLAMTTSQHLAALEARSTIDAGVTKLRQSEAQTRAVLESLGEGLVVFDLAGRTAPLASRAITKWFGPVAPGTPISDYLLPDGPERAMFAMMVDQLCGDIFPFESAADQFPKVLEHRASGAVTTCSFSLGLSPVLDQGALSSVILTLRDVTEETRLRRESLEARDLLQFLERAREQPDEAAAFLSDTEAELTAHGSQPLVELKRSLHTIKGNAATFGMESFAQAVHSAEGDVDERGEFVPQAASVLTSKWATFASQARALLRDTLSQSASVPRDLIEPLALVLERHHERDSAELVRSFLLSPVLARLEVLRRQALATARRLNKAVEVSVQAEAGIALDMRRFAPLFRSLVHVVRNAVDHGIEASEAREASGKSPTGHLRIEAKAAGSRLTLSIADDGPGIDFERLAVRAQSMGLPTATHQHLVQALFADGVSTRTEVTDVSGRGVGLAAVLFECTKLGGVADVQVHQGTRFVFELPLSPATVTLVAPPLAAGA